MGERRKGEGRGKGRGRERGMVGEDGGTVTVDYNVVCVRSGLGCH